MMLNIVPNADELEIFSQNAPEDTSMLAVPDIFLFDLC